MQHHEDFHVTGGLQVQQNKRSQVTGGLQVQHDEHSDEEGDDDAEEIDDGQRVAPDVALVRAVEHVRLGDGALQAQPKMQTLHTMHLCKICAHTVCTAGN